MVKKLAGLGHLAYQSRRMTNYRDKKPLAMAADAPLPKGAQGTKMEEPVAVYGAPEAPALAEAVDHWLGVLHRCGVATTAVAGSALRQVREALRKGIPREVFDRVHAELGVTTDELADVLGIPSRTLARRTERFKPDESERLLRVVSVAQRARDVLEDSAAARRWLTQPKTALGGLTPLRCCDTELGAREVEALLGRIEHGVFS